MSWSMAGKAKTSGWTVAVTTWDWWDCPCDNVAACDAGWPNKASAGREGWWADVNTSPLTAPVRLLTRFGGEETKASKASADGRLERWQLKNLVNSENKENLSNYQLLKRKPSIFSTSLHFSKLITVVQFFFPWHRFHNGFQLNFGAGNFRGRRPGSSALRMLMRLTAVSPRPQFFTEGGP